MAPRQRIVWKSRLTDKSGHGHWFQSWIDLTETVIRLNQTDPDVDHWIETEPSWTEVDTSTEDTEIIQ